MKRLNEDLERRVEERTAELTLSNRELESFSYSVVHDLRAPLRGMGGFAEVLLTDCKDTLSADAQQLTGVAGSPLLVVEENLNAAVDPKLARALIEILLENALKFSAKGTAPRIEIGATETDGEHALYIRDNGAGFDMAHADKLFVPFGRLHTVGEFPGIGIGIATAQRIVQRHGGRIWADGHVGEGAVIHFKLCTKSEGARI